jgi:hypothetical protein
MLCSIWVEPLRASTKQLTRSRKPMAATSVVSSLKAVSRLALETNDPINEIAATHDVLRPPYPMRVR